MGAGSSVELQRAVGGKKAECQAAFNKYDTSGNGRLEGKELVSFVDDVKKLLSSDPDPAVRQLAVASSADEWIAKASRAQRRVLLGSLVASSLSTAPTRTMMVR